MLSKSTKQKRMMANLAQWRRRGKTARESKQHGVSAVGEARGGQLEHLTGDLALPLAALEIDERLQHLFRVAGGAVHGREAAGLLTGERIGGDPVQANGSVLDDQARDQRRVGQLAAVTRGRAAKRSAAPRGRWAGSALRLALAG